MYFLHKNSLARQCERGCLGCDKLEPQQNRVVPTRLTTPFFASLDNL